MHKTALSRGAFALAALLVGVGSAQAQSSADKSKEKPPAGKAEMEHKMDMSKMDMSKMSGTDHAMSPWKELDAYHMLMMATWHPVQEKKDLAPTRAKIGEMLTAAKTLAASTAPKGCDAPTLRETAAALPAATQKVADLVASKADDATLTAAMKSLHTQFDVLEMGCTNPKPATEKKP